MTTEVAGQETTWEDMSISDRADTAWTKKAELDTSAAVDSLRAQLIKKLKIGRDDIEIATDRFDDEVSPFLRVAAFVDGLTFCLTHEKELALHAWTCAESGCTERYRLAVSDYTTLGRAMWLGEKEESERPHCRAHKKKGERW
jgi:hypothetical protein